MGRRILLKAVRAKTQFVIQFKSRVFLLFKEKVGESKRKRKELTLGVKKRETAGECKSNKRRRRRRECSEGSV